MTNCSSQFRRYLKRLSCLMLFTGFFLMFPLKTMAQKESTGLLSLVSRRASAIQVSFTYSPTYPQVGQAVQFTDTSKDRMTSWAWDFGDGTTSVSQNPSHSYSAAGYYSVALTASNSSGSRTARRSISATISNAAAFTYSPASPRIGQLIQFTDTTSGNPTSWLWHFGEGTVSTDKNPIHAYGIAALYKVTLVAGTSSGSKDVSRTISVMASPASTTLSASFIFSPTSPTAGQAVQFTDTSTGSPTSWLWNFGDGTTSTTQNPSHSFTTAASYTVTLTTTGSSGSKNSSQTIAVSPALAASFTYSPVSPVAGQPVQFTDTSTGSPTSWQWNFGDGSTSTAKNPSHSYATIAAYNVALTVSNSSGSKNASLTVNILPSTALIASFTYSPTAPLAGQPVQFTDTSTGTPTSWQWDFGDGTLSAVQNPSHTYTAAGSYSGTLTIRTSSNVDNTSQAIIVGRADVITAASPSYADVSAAISAAHPGDIVTIPPGTATWNAPLVITKSIKLIGAGIDKTVIISSYTCNLDTIDPKRGLISFVPATPASNPPFRLSGLTLNVDSKCDGIWLYNATLNACDQIRLDHLYIYNCKSSSGFPRPALARYGPVYGVMDNCIINGGIANQSLHSLWTNTPYNFGDSQNFYIEDNVWSGDGLLEIFSDGNESPRYCIRHNTIDASSITRDGLYPFCDLHGNQASSGHCASQGAEIYENDINAGSKGIMILDQRGGKVLVYNNRVTVTSGDAGTKVREEENDNLMPPINNAVSGQPQHVSDSYYWGNRVNSSKKIDAYVAASVDYGGSVGLVPQENREFWNEQTSFDGTVGIGIGPIASRPSKCRTGVAYWTTDENKLYRAVTTNTWTLYYVPYTYPHPLRTSLSTQSTDGN